MSSVRVALRSSNLALGLTAAVLVASCGGGGDASGPTPALSATADPAASTSTSTASGTGAGGQAGASAGTSASGNVTALATTIASEGASFKIDGTQSVNYGVDGASISKDVSGTGSCTNAFFGTDPRPGVVKSCWIVTPAAAAPLIAPVMAADSLMPVIDASRIPVGAVGYATERVAAANVADPSQNPVGSDIGDFREYCEFSHMSYDDPIVSPGAIGTHLHTFMGNTATNRNSTALSIATTGNSTCAGGILNRTSYWFPTMIDTQDGTPLKPLGSLIYYKQGYHYVDSASIKQFPAGLRMVAGNSASTGIQDGIASFSCFKPDGTATTGKAIPANCPAGSTLTVSVAFPQCWDGVNLDSPDHKSHMAYAGIGCPSTHPVVLTEISFQINYPVTRASGTSNWRLSSDNYDKSLPGGYSSHADWFGGWNPAIQATWTTRCINATLDCHAFLIGDGRILY